MNPEKKTQCCSRDHNHDGNCDQHPGPSAQPKKLSLLARWKMAWAAEREAHAKAKAQKVAAKEKADYDKFVERSQMLITRLANEGFQPLRSCFNYQVLPSGITVIAHMVRDGKLYKVTYTPKDAVSIESV
jgi:hypothetical protein